MTSLTAESISPKAVLVPHPLVRFCVRAQKGLWGLRLGRLYGFGVGASYALLVLVGPASLGVAAQLWARALTIVSWVAGVGALSLATDLASRDATLGLTGLARLRGVGERELERARTIAGARRLSTMLLASGLLVVLAVLLRFRTVHGSLAALGLACVTVPYAVLVGATLAALARACSRWLPGRGRLLLMALTLGPWLLGSGTGLGVPSIPSAFAWLLEQAARSFR